MKTEKTNDDYSLGFKTEQVPFALLKLSLQNNAILRLILHDQNRILQKLKLKSEFPIEIFQDLDPFLITADKKMRPEDYIERVEDLAMVRLWEWLNLNVEIIKPTSNEQNDLIG